jgi:hypothetical protein
MIALERAVHESERSALARDCERALRFSHEAHCPQRRDITPNLYRDVGRQQTGEVFARAVTDARARTGLPSGARPSTAMSDPIELELFCYSTHQSVV